MPKLKTKKAARDRFKITRKKKLLSRKIHQGHFNAKDSGEEGRNKKGFKKISKPDIKSIKKHLPYA